MSNKNTNHKKKPPQRQAGGKTQSGGGPRSSSAGAGSAGKSSSPQGKKPRGPSRASGALSIAMALFGLFWAYTLYKQKGLGWEPVFGVVFAGLCLGHAAYNFRAVSRQEAIARGDIPDPQKEAEAAAAAGRGANGQRRQGRYPVYRVKAKPKRLLKKKGAAATGVGEEKAV